MSAITCTVDGCGRPALDAYVCQACALDLERALGDVRWLDEQLDIVLTKQTSGAASIGFTKHPGREQPLPYDPRATEVRWVLANTVMTWARVVAEENPKARLPTVGGIGILAAWLASYSGWLRQHQAADQAVEEVLAAVAAARRLVDVRPERWYAGPCPQCSHDLYAGMSARVIECPACGECVDSVTRREYLLTQARDHSATIRECVGLFRGTVTRDQVKGWVRRGKVIASGSTMVDGRAVATYRIGDLLAVSEEERDDEGEQRATKRAGRQSAQ